MNELTRKRVQRNQALNLGSVQGKSQSLTLRKKVRLIFIIALISLIGVLYITFSSILLSNATKAEEHNTRQAVQGVLNIFAQTEDDFTSRFSDWSAWDDAYTFIEDANKHFIESNLISEQLAELEVNLVIFVHSSGRIVFGTGFDVKNQKIMPIPETLRKHISLGDLLLYHSTEKSKLTGIVALPEGPMLLTSQPILNSKGKGPSRGSIIFGRYLDADRVRKFAGITHGSLTWYGLHETKLPADFQTVRSRLTVKQPILIRPLNQQTIVGYALLTDIYNEAGVLLRVDVPREIYQQAQSSIYYLISSFIVVGLGFSGITLPLLERLILFQCERQEQEKALQQSEQRLCWQASHDSLTGLVNRYEFEQRVQEAILSTRVYLNHLLPIQHALCYLDLDQFKIINDICGHEAGDTLLRQTSTLLQAGLRQTDILARLGGDEFGLLLYQCSLEEAVEIANKLREQINQFRFIWQGKIFSISVSIGVVAINATTSCKNSALSTADIACYAAKNRGRNRVHVYQNNDSELVQQRGEMQWVTRITRALEDNRFRLYYQPIVPTKPTKINQEHWEILLRLEDETGKMVLPMAFVPAAERYGMMQLVDRWVISTLFAYLAQQYQANPVCSLTQSCPQVYAINLSGASINDEQFIYFVQKQLALYQIPPSIICFEITETVAISNLDKAAQFLHALRSLGCRFALDDFGSGMSSLAYLKKLPVDYLKIDGIFIKEIVKDVIASEMVAAISRIASVMGIETVAEFVMNDAILAKIRALGVDYAQGYAICEPRPLSISDTSLPRQLVAGTS